MSPDVLPAVTPELRVAESPRPAQIRLKIGDMGAAKVAPFLRAQQYLRERETSRVNARLLDSFTQQLRVPDDGARDAAFVVLGAKPVCPLGGEYRRDPPNYQFSTHQPWFSTAWPAPEDRWQPRSFAERQSFSALREVPADYNSRLLEWFKGLNIEVQFTDQTMLTHIELDVAQ